MYAARKRLSSVRVLAATTVRRWKKAQIKAKQQQQQKKKPEQANKMYRALFGRGKCLNLRKAHIYIRKGIKRQNKLHNKYV